MKKWCLILVAVLAYTGVYAEFPEKVEILCSKAVLKNEQGYFVLSDGSIWKAIGFAKRWRSLGEWWNSVKLVPEQYETLPDQWHLGTSIEAYPKYSSLAVNEADASNQAELKQCTHLLVNTRTGQVLFALALDPAQALLQIFDEARVEGYNEGYSSGYTSGRREVNATYEHGYKAGYDIGYTAGVQSMVNGNDNH